jgi:hypothetical protein
MSAPTTWYPVSPEDIQAVARREYQDPPLKIGGTKRKFYYIRAWVKTISAGARIKKRYVRLRLGYLATTTDPQERQKRGEITEREAQRVRAAKVAEINGQVYTMASHIPFDDFAEIWREKHVRREDNLGAGTKKKYEQHLDKHVLPAFRGRKLSDVTTAAIDDFLSSVKKENGEPQSYWTKVDLKNLLSSVFTKAHDWGYWKDRNPVEAATVGKKRWARERRILTDEQAVALFGVLPHVVQVILKTLDCTGMRISELLGLLQSRLFSLLDLQRYASPSR